MAALVGAPPLPPGGGGGVFGGDDGGERGEARGGREGGEAAPCRLEGRVEDWKPPTTADLRSSYRWTDEQKVTKTCWLAYVLAVDRGVTALEPKLPVDYLVWCGALFPLFGWDRKWRVWLCLRSPRYNSQGR